MTKQTVTVHQNVPGSWLCKCVSHTLVWVVPSTTSVDAFLLLPLLHYLDALSYKTEHKFFTGSSPADGPMVSSYCNTKATYQTNGNVGIGTSSATAGKLVVEQSGATPGLVVQNGTNPQMRVVGGTTTAKLQAITDGSVYVGSETNSSVSIIVNNNSVLGADTSGNINIISGNLQSNAVTRLTNAGVLQNVTNADASTFFTGGSLSVARGGTGAGTFTGNGVLYGNGTGALQVTAASTGANQCLITATSGGAPSWGSCTAGGGVTTFTAIGATPNANGGTISGNNITLQPANASFGGVVTTGAQTLRGIRGSMVLPLLHNQAPLTMS